MPPESQDRKMDDRNMPDESLPDLPVINVPVISALSAFFVVSIVSVARWFNPVFTAKKRKELKEKLFYLWQTLNLTFTLNHNPFPGGLRLRL